MLIGIDTGGTFTDFVVFDGESLRIHKVLSTPDAPERAILQGLRDLGIAPEQDGVRIVHGSTVGTNAVLEGKGARTAFITNRGLQDLLTIGRQARGELYNLQPPVVAAPVPRELCLGTGGRLSADGTTIEPLSEDDLSALRIALHGLQPRAVAINLLFSYLDDTAERRIQAALPDHMFISRSSALLPEIREYERGIATWLNAAVGPLMQGYLQRLCKGAGRARVAVMQSSGGSIAADQAGEQAVHLLLSGPAGGLVGARAIAALSGCERLLSFDMGGTSTDVALIDGEPRLTSEGRIGPYPVAVPMVDLDTIGAGGGSIASVDACGLLQVGPASAGAHPGPACYGSGGEAATVTDANLVLGRLDPEQFLGGRMQLDMQAARRVLAPVATALGLDIETAAEGIVRVANEHMARALRVVSVQRGVDPRALTLVSFGGAGGLHVCALAEALNMSQALVPVHGGVLSALGMLAAPPLRDYSRSVPGLLHALDTPRVQIIFRELEAQGRAELLREQVQDAQIQVEYSTDLRYQGQSYTLRLPWRDIADLAEAFHREHARQYRHCLDQPIELVNLRVRVRGAVTGLRFHTGLPSMPTIAGARHKQLHGIAAKAPFYQRGNLPAGTMIDGPAVIAEAISTTYLAPGWQARIDEAGNILLRCLTG